MGVNAKIIEELATIKANTKNHNGELKELKETFNKHIDKEEKQIDSIHYKIESFHCPGEERITKLERRIHDNTAMDQKRRVSDLEIRNQDIKERALKDEAIAEDISSLRSTRKYNYASTSGIYILIGVILKKIFS